jgi:hypothetical protein
VGELTYKTPFVSWKLVFFLNEFQESEFQESEFQKNELFSDVW